MVDELGSTSSSRARRDFRSMLVRYAVVRGCVMGLGTLSKLEGGVHGAIGSGFNGPSVGERRYLLLIKESMENHIPVTMDGSTAACVWCGCATSLYSRVHGSDW
jgi:hypothetical protein